MASLLCCCKPQKPKGVDSDIAGNQYLDGRRVSEHSNTGGAAGMVKAFTQKLGKSMNRKKKNDAAQQTAFEDYNRFTVAQSVHGEVYFATSNGKSCTIKRIYKNESDALRDYNAELKGFQQAGEHKNILKFIDTYEDSVAYYLVLDFYACGTLECIFEDFSQFTEQNVREIITQLALGLNYLHTRDIVHFHLNLSNIVVKSWKPIHVAISDFNYLIKYKKAKGKLRVKPVPTQESEDIVQKILNFGPILFRAPEIEGSIWEPIFTDAKKKLINQLNVNKGKFASDHQNKLAANAEKQLEQLEPTFKVDVWSLGVIMYHLLSHRDFPFGLNERDLENIMKVFHDNKTHVFKELLKQKTERAKKAELDFDGEEDRYQMWKMVSPEAKDLLKNLLKIKPDLRCDYEDVLASPWMVANVPNESLYSPDEYEELQERIARVMQTSSAVM